jgi:hypothetical protein
VSWDPREDKAATATSRRRFIDQRDTEARVHKSYLGDHGRSLEV